MARIFRHLAKNLYWEPERRPDEDWLAEDDVRADVFRDLKTEANILSVYVLERDEDLDRLIAAYSANRGNVKSIDFALFDMAGLAAIEIEAVPILGDVPDVEVAEWHRDGNKLLAFAKLVQRSAQLERRSDKQVGQLINKAIAQTYIDVARLKPEMISDLAKGRYRPPPVPAPER